MEKDRSDILAVFDDFFRNISSGQGLRNLDLYDLGGDCRLIGSGKGEEAYGEAGLRSFFQAGASRPVPFDFSWQDVNCTIEGSASWVFAKGRVTGGGLAQPLDFFLTCIFVRRDGAWRVSHFHGSEPR